MWIACHLSWCLPTSQELRPIVWVWPRDVVILVVEDDVQSLLSRLTRYLAWLSSCVLYPDGAYGLT